MNLIGKLAPNFKTIAVVNNQFKEVNLSDYKGKYVLLFFYPLDFTFVCPTELHQLQANLKEFEKLNTQVLAISVDSKFSHLKWLETEKQEGGIKGIEYPLLEDLGAAIAKQYYVLNEENVAYRGTFLIDETQTVQHISINNLNVGRNIEEYLRLIAAFEHSKKTGNVCPASWKTEQAGIKATKEAVKEYLKK